MSSAADSGRSVVGLDASIALVAIANAGLMSVSVGIHPEWWWVGVAVTLGTALLVAAADRSNAGLWALVGVGIAAILAIPLSMAFDAFPRGALPIAILAMGAGILANRVAFGVVGSVPEFRRERQS